MTTIATLLLAFKTILDLFPFNSLMAFSSAPLRLDFGSGSLSWSYLCWH